MVMRSCLAYVAKQVFRGVHPFKTRLCVVSVQGLHTSSVISTTSKLQRMDNQALRVRTVLGCMEFGRQPDIKASSEMVKIFLDCGHNELDTAYIYTNGKSEEFLGEMEFLKNPEQRHVLATKVHPIGTDGKLTYKGTIEQFGKSLERLKRSSVDILYLHSPDHDTPIEETLKAVHQLHSEGKIKELGLSNYAAWQVAEIYYLCKLNGYVLPTVYQGMYNAITREVERELFPCIRRLGMRFYAYNPLAGGLLVGKYHFEDKDHGRPDGRFLSKWKGADMYKKRFWKKPLFDAVDDLKEALNQVYGAEKVSLREASFRWLCHHSMLSAEQNDAVILGASTSKQLEENIQSMALGPLHEEIVQKFEEAWEHAKAYCASYLR